MEEGMDEWKGERKAMWEGSWGGGERGTEEKEKVEIWEDHDKRKQRQEVREVKDVGWLASVPLVAGVDVI